MAKAMDRRAARTRKLLHRALMSLIMRKGYETVTIQDIINEADVGRSTFYAHYAGKEDLLRSGMQLLRAELADARGEQPMGSQGELLGFSLTLFEHAAGYADVYRALVGGRGGSVAINEIRQILSEFVRKELSAVQHHDNDAVARELAVQFVLGAFLTVLTWWLERRPNLTPSQVDVMFRRLVINGIGPSIDGTFRARRE